MKPNLQRNNDDEPKECWRLPDPAKEQVSQRELDRGHFTTPTEFVASALRLLNSHEDWLQENREAIIERLELSFEQSRTGKTYTTAHARQLLAKRRAGRQ